MARARRSLWPVVLMACGLVVLVAAGLRLASGGDEGLDSPDAAAAFGSCDIGGCKANADPSPVRGYDAPSVVVDPDDPDHVVISDMNLVGGRCAWHVTFDGGQTWEDGVFDIPAGFRSCQLDSGGYLSAGNLARGPSGAMYFVLSSARVGADNVPTEGESVLVARSDDGGRTFAPATVAVPGGPLDVTYLRPVVTAVAGPTGDDRLLLSFWDCYPPLGEEPGRCHTTQFAQSLDGGRTFSPPVLVSLDPGGNSPSAPVVDADGTVHVLFLRRYDDGNVDLVLARSTDGGATFSNTTIDRQPTIGRQYDAPRLASDPQGRVLYTVFSDDRQGRQDVYFRDSTDGGDTWGQAAVLNSPNDGASFLPDISVGPEGRIDVVFFQRSRENVDEVMWTSSSDGGQVFERPLQLNEKSIDRDIGYTYEVGDSYGADVTSTAGAALVVWSDSRLGTPATDTQDTAFRRVDVGRGNTSTG